MHYRHLAGGFQSNLVLAYSVQLQKYSTPTVVTTASSSLLSSQLVEKIYLLFHAFFQCLSLLNISHVQSQKERNNKNVCSNHTNNHQREIGNKTKSFFFSLKVTTSWSLSHSHNNHHLTKIKGIGNNYQADDIGFVIERKGLLRGFNGDEDKLKLLSDVKVIVVHGIIEVDLQTDFNGESEMEKVIVSLWESWCCCEIDGGLVEVETERKDLEVYEV